MHTTIEAEIDVTGQITLLEPVKINKKSRAIVTILDNGEEYSAAPACGGIRQSFGTWQANPGFSEYPPGSSHNERIDIDLARGYAETQEEES